MKVSLQDLRGKTEAELRSIPQVTGAAGGQVYISQRLNRILTHAEAEAKQFKDDYTSVEHLLLAMGEDSGASAVFSRRPG